LVDVDSYFASYRNYFNVCSYHKNGCESVQVFRSKTLQKKVHFPPAKHTKFEEWIAIQVDAQGTVTIYDFRPDGIAFDDIPVNVSPAMMKGDIEARRCEDDRRRRCDIGPRKKRPASPDPFMACPRTVFPDTDDEVESPRSNYPLGKEAFEMLQVQAAAQWSTQAMGGTWSCRCGQVLSVTRPQCSCGYLQVVDPCPPALPMKQRRLRSPPPPPPPPPPPSSRPQGADLRREFETPRVYRIGPPGAPREDP